MIKENIKYGLFLGIATSFVTQVLTWLGLGTSNWFVLLTYILVIVFVFIVIRKQWVKNNSITFLHAILIVSILILVSRYVFQLYMFIYTRYINPNWIDEVSIVWTEIMKENNASEIYISRQLSAFRKSYEPFSMFFIEVFKYGISQIILGVIISLYFVFKKPKN